MDVSEIFSIPAFWTAVAYIILAPLSVFLVGMAQKALVVDSYYAKPKNRQTRANPPEPVLNKWSKWFSFAIRDKRSVMFNGKTVEMSRQKALWLGILGGLVLAVISGFLQMWWIMPLAFIVFYATLGVSFSSAKKLLDERQKVLARMLEIAQSTLGQNSSNPNEVIEVTEWKDLVEPQKVMFKIPTKFNADGESLFLRQFNQVFGRTQTWIADYDEGGWNYEEGKAYFKTVPPLPTMAPWDERYLFDPAIGDDFFPIGVGVEGGLELPNGEDGEVLNILGYDVLGTEKKVAEKAGVKVSASASVAAPHVLVAGGTGGGKAMAVDTLVEVVEKPKKPQS